jgi:hypothetical protein
MTADEILRSLNSNPAEARLHELVLAIDARRTDIKRRLAETSSQAAGSAFPSGRARAEAEREGLTAMKRLDDEETALSLEFDMLGKLEQRAVEQTEALKIATAKNAASGARRKLPGACQRVRKALEELDSAMLEIGALIAPLGEVAAQPREKFPLSDDELAELFETREAIWAPRNLAALIPPSQETHPKAWNLFYDVINPEIGGTITRRPAPSRHRVDVSGGQSVNLGRLSW